MLWAARDPFVPPSSPSRRSTALAAPRARSRPRRSRSSPFPPAPPSRRSSTRPTAASATSCAPSPRCAAPWSAPRRTSRATRTRPRRRAIGKARVKLAKAWGRAEKRVAKEVDCRRRRRRARTSLRRVEEAAAALARRRQRRHRPLRPRRRRVRPTDPRGRRDRLHRALPRAEPPPAPADEGPAPLRLASDESHVLADSRRPSATRGTGAGRPPTGPHRGPARGLVTDALAIDHVARGDRTTHFAMITPEPVAYEGKELAPICLYEARRTSSSRSAAR